MVAFAAPPNGRWIIDGGNMGRQQPGDYSASWSAPSYTVDDNGKVSGAYTPEGTNNWGRWGDDDQIGTQNLIGPEQRLNATREVSSGKVFSLALPIDASGPRFHTRPAPLHWFLMTGSDQITGTPYAAVDPGFQWNDDMFQMPLQGSTQWDAFAHIMYQDTMYNGYWAGNVTAFGGAAVLGIDQHATSFVGRAVLMDVARSEGHDALPRNTVVNRAMLERCASNQATEVQPGDMILIRTGYLASWDPTWNPDEVMHYFSGSPGLGVSALGWCHDNNVSAVATDTIAVEVFQPEDPEARRYPVHVGALVDLGLPLGEFWVLDELAADCAADGRYEFMLVAPPLRIPGAVGSPINPIALK
jgi:kynurenine formamidase